ncbi:helix-turn-helix transcriptional regulator [Epilithonimonas sp. JDS]|uniref:helix-turn-helix domain-containing protein n=1 Tax=Epilithonimonas sp. JDS TaxID=2902797 RepID=UPI001E627CC4|nr:helix-turn-helix transcriptional regulator [Epilithonimonas sp. JDS]MCD9855596.1 helix-turn-helix transcriptional regulator [Epilithonimonas sp. JDS]
MRKNTHNIPVNSMDSDSHQGISIDKINLEKSDFTHSHRDEGHTFHILEKGTVHLEIDFNQYEISAPCVVYMHPNQVHRILSFDHITICSLSVNDEHLNPDYLKLLEEITPTTPLELSDKNYLVFYDLFKLCHKFSIEKNSKLHYSLFKDSCNMVVAFLISQFLDHKKEETHHSRFEIITQHFKKLLEKNYRTYKRPAAYADQLNISTSYLNECVKNTTGSSVSQHIQNRVVLEAKRMLYYSDKSIKEISFELGYDDYTYFSRLFTKATGMSALSFRNKYHD